MTVKEIFQYDTGGIIYISPNGEILATGTTQDSAGPDPENAKGIFIYCQSPARTLYAVADTPITYRVKNSLAVTTTPNRDQFLAILSENFFFRVTGGAGAQDLDSVLTIGNNAGANDIDLNGNDITNAYKVFTEFVNGMPLINLELTSDVDIIFNPNGIIDANGKTLNMRNGEIHAAHLIHGRNNTNFPIQAKGTGDLIFETNNIERLRITSAGQFVGLPNIEGWNVIVKSANQDVTNNATLQDDTELQFSVVAGGHYMIELNAVVSMNNTTSRYSNRLDISAGTMKGMGIMTNISNAGSAQVTTLSAFAAANTAATSIINPSIDIDGLTSLKIIYSFTASANAIFKYKFANLVGALGGISRTWKGSILKYKRID